MHHASWLTINGSWFQVLLKEAGQKNPGLNAGILLRNYEYRLVFATCLKIKHRA